MARSATNARQHEATSGINGVSSTYRQTDRQTDRSTAASKWPAKHLSVIDSARETDLARSLAQLPTVRSQITRFQNGILTF
jgi:hypothetical protein